MLSQTTQPNPRAGEGRIYSLQNKYLFLVVRRIPEIFPKAVSPNSKIGEDLHYGCLHTHERAWVLIEVTRVRKGQHHHPSGYN